MIDARVRRFGRAWREDLIGQWQDLVGRWEIWSDSERFGRTVYDERQKYPPQTATHRFGIPMTADSIFLFFSFFDHIGRAADEIQATVL